MTKPLLRPNQRYDLEDFNLGLSALRTDSHFYTKRFLSQNSHIMQGFTISQVFIGQPTAEINIENATLINGNNSGDISWWTAPETPDPITIPVGIGGLQAGRNYVELEVFAEDGTPLQRAFWDPSANSGQGVEFTQEVDTVTELFVRAVVNQTGFTGDPDFVQLAIIDIDGSFNIKGIKDRRSLFYRLGHPDDIHAAFAWNSQTEPTTTLTFTAPSGTPFVVGEIVSFTSGATAEVVVGGTNNIQVFDFSNENMNPGDSVTGGTSGATASLQSYYEDFEGADKDIHNQKEAFDALATEIRRVKGTDYWYEIGGVASLPSLLNFVNSILVPISSGARFEWSGTALKITDNKTSAQATSDVIAAIRIPGSASQLLITREDGTGGSGTLSIPDQSILYMELPASGNRTYSESGPGVTNFKIASLAAFVPTDHNYILAYREGTKVILTGLGELEAGESVEVSDSISYETLEFIGAASDSSRNPQYTTLPSADLSNQFTSLDSLTQAISINAANINDISSAILHPYEELLSVVALSGNDNEVTGPLLSGAALTLPLDSRDSNVQKRYKVGLGVVIVCLNGQVLPLSAVDGWSEIGAPGSLSSTFQVNQALVVGDVLDIKIINPQFFGTVGDDQDYFVNYITGQLGDQIPVGDIYNVGTDRLQVWRNGIAMQKTSSIGDLIDRYQEPNANSITLSEDAGPSEVFTMVNHESPNPNVTLQTGITGTVLTVPLYTIGDGSLRVFRNGVLLSTLGTAPTDLKYTETSTTTITLDMAATVNDVFKIFRSGVAPTFRQRNIGFTGTTLTIPGGSSYTLGDQHLLVFRNGVLMLNSLTLSNAADRYQEASTTTILLETAATAPELFEFIYI